MLQNVSGLLEEQQGIRSEALYKLHLCQCYQALHILRMLLPNSALLHLHDESFTH